MPSKTQKIVSSIILGLSAVMYILFGIVILSKVQNIIGILFIVSAAIAVGAIIGIICKNKILLWLGIAFSLIQIVDGISSLTNKFIFNEDISVGSHVLIAILYVLPIVVMYRIVKNKGGITSKQG